MAVVLRNQNYTSDVRYLPVASSTTIAKGDIVFLDQDRTVVPAEAADIGTLSQNQILVAQSFAGIALAASKDGQTEDIPVRIAGDYLADCTASTFSVGDLVGCADDGSGGASNQTLVKVSERSRALGHVITNEPNATSLVKVHLFGILKEGLPAREMTTIYQNASPSTSSDILLTSFPNGGRVMRAKARLGTGCDTTETVSLQFTNGSGNMGSPIVLDNALGTDWTNYSASLLPFDPNTELYLDITVTNPSTAANLDLVFTTI